MTLSPFIGTCIEKQLEIKKIFLACSTPESRYEKIIELGRHLETYPEKFKLKENLVGGCQSVMYLHAWLEEDKIRFYAHSEALISAGLAALLLFVYDGQSPETLFTAPPHFLEELGIASSLSPGR